MSFKILPINVRAAWEIPLEFFVHFAVATAQPVVWTHSMLGIRFLSAVVEFVERAPPHLAIVLAHSDIGRHSVQRAHSVVVHVHNQVRASSVGGHLALRLDLFAAACAVLRNDLVLVLAQLGSIALSLLPRIQVLVELVLVHDQRRRLAHLARGEEGIARHLGVRHHRVQFALDHVARAAVRLQQLDAVEVVRNLVLAAHLVLPENKVHRVLAHAHRFAQRVLAPFERLAPMHRQQCSLRLLGDDALVAEFVAFLKIIPNQ
mmetsp:Transcript_11922/g.17996  ORF Transcript_11922/g.17996 Transcript_11922/m.17996 type:complete len:261 (-) Transcript_11922:322-1104(-)